MRDHFYKTVATAAPPRSQPATRAAGVAARESASPAPEPPPRPPEAFGFGLLITPLQNDELTLVGILINRTSQPVQVTWRDTHPYLAVITDKSGTAYSLNAHLPPPQPSLQPTTVEAGSDFIRVFPFRAKDWPDFKFDPAQSPYRFEITLNSDTHRLSASITVDVPQPPPPDDTTVKPGTVETAKT